MDSEEATLTKHLHQHYAHTPFETFSAAGYVNFAYTVEDFRWNATIHQNAHGRGDEGEDADGEENYYPLARREMDRLWVRVVMGFWVRMAWCGGEGGGEDVEGVVIALLEVSGFLCLWMDGERGGGEGECVWWNVRLTEACVQREDGPGVEEMWENREMEYPDLDTSVSISIILLLGYQRRIANFLGGSCATQWWDIMASLRIIWI